MRGISACFLGAALAVGATAANAATVNELVDFTVGGFTSAFGEPVPTDPVTGSFTITFDPTQTYTDETTGIVLNSLNIGLDSALAFDYSPTGNGNGAPDELVVGGLESGASSITLGPTGADFYLHLLSFTSNPTFQQLGYRTAETTSDSNYFYTLTSDKGLPGEGVTFSVTVTPVTPSVPELSTWAMMLVGFAGVGFLAYRKHQRFAAV
jgi:hypothetical protein